MAHRKFLYAALASALIAGSAAPAFAQGYLDRMKEAAARRAENKAVMDAEHPENDKTAAATTDKTAATAPAAATTAAAAPAPAAPAAAAPAPAPSQSAAATPATPAPAAAQ